MSRRVAFAVSVRSAVLSLAVLCVARPAVAAAPAGGGGGQPPDPKASIERTKRCLREVSALVSKVSFDRKDVETLLAEWRSFDALELGDADDAAEGPECLDLDAAVADPGYVAWARKRKLDPKGWLLKSTRISLTHAKRRAPAQAAEMKAQLEAQRQELAKHCKSMGPDACRQLEEAFAGADEMAREASAMVALFPEPTRAEAALLGEYDDRLRDAFEGTRRGGEGGGDADAGDSPPEDDERK